MDVALACDDSGPTASLMSISSVGEALPFFSAVTQLWLDGVTFLTD
jgi:hypothetical protein